MKKRIPEHLMIIEWSEPLDSVRSIDKVAMFNTTVVDETTVRGWVESGLLDVVLKPSVVVMTKQQYNNLYDKSSCESEAAFYDDLRLEQQGGIV